ncbi:MAG: hypothetical protein AB7P33_14400 [Dehalococcoidia bacterium]
MLEVILNRLRGPKTPLGVTSVGLRTPAETLKMSSPAADLNLHRPDEQLRRYAPKAGLRPPGC